MTIDAANAFLEHLGARGYSPATVRAYAFDLADFVTFLTERELTLGEVVPSDVFAYPDWQREQQPRQRRADGKVVALTRAGPAPATMNRRVSAVRGLFAHQVMAGLLADHPVPAARRANGLRTPPRGMLGHVGPGRPRGGGRLVRQTERLPESVDGDDVARFLADLLTYRDRAVVLVMVLGGLRAVEVRCLRLADVDMGLGRVRVVGKGGRERIVPVDRVFFAECAASLREERPAGCPTSGSCAGCSTVASGSTRSWVTRHGCGSVPSGPQPPPYLLNALGSPPTDSWSLSRWERTATDIEKHRLRWEITDKRNALGSEIGEPRMERACSLLRDEIERTARELAPRHVCQRSFVRGR